MTKEIAPFSFNVLFCTLLSSLLIFKINFVFEFLMKFKVLQWFLFLSELVSRVCSFSVIQSLWLKRVYDSAITRIFLGTVSFTGGSFINSLFSLNLPVWKLKTPNLFKKRKKLIEAIFISFVCDQFSYSSPKFISRLFTFVVLCFYKSFTFLVFTKNKAKKKELKNKTKKKVKNETKSLKSKNRFIKRHSEHTPEVILTRSRLIATSNKSNSLN